MEWTVPILECIIQIDVDDVVERDRWRVPPAVFDAALKITPQLNILFINHIRVGTYVQERFSTVRTATFGW